MMKNFFKIFTDVITKVVLGTISSVVIIPD